MGGGYVLNFSDRTFAEFFDDVVALDIDDPKYHYQSGSKANRMRQFWRVAPDGVVATVLEQMISLAQELGAGSKEVARAREIVARLASSSPVHDLDALEPNADGRSFEVLARSVRACIKSNQPELGLDRLHTFVFRYIGVLASAEGIESPVGKPLHAVFAELLKALKRRDAVESEMGERILKSTISILESFNHVRNNRTFAHDNELLSHEEALLIFNHVSSAMRFLASVVQKPQVLDGGEDEANDLPF